MDDKVSIIVCYVTKLNENLISMAANILQIPKKITLLAIKLSGFQTLLEQMVTCCFFENNS